MAIEADFVALDAERPGDRRFAVLHLPDGGLAPRGLVVHAPAFAEEMNKSRRAVAVQARRLAAQGLGVLLVDPLGTGDSPGDFGDASWDDWVRDMTGAMAWLRREFALRWPGDAEPARVFWGLRAGALLANAAARLTPGPCARLYWQPATQGAAVLQQFLRLLGAADLAAGRGGGRAAAARASLAAGESQEVAGYVLSPSLASGLEAAVLQASEPASRLLVLESSSRADTAPSPASRDLVSRWAAAGWQAEVRCITGPAFWQTTEIEDSPALWEASSQAMRDLCDLAARADAAVPA